VRRASKLPLVARATAHTQQEETQLRARARFGASRSARGHAAAPPAPFASAGGLTTEFVDELAHWLVEHQPISLALNVPYDTALRLFDRTALVVNTVGYPHENRPAYTCQARPQDSECFGEFPPRRDLTKYTKFPVHIPSSTAGYHASYTRAHLRQLAQRALPPSVAYCAPLLDAATSEETRGYCVAILEYLVEATAVNPKRGKSGPSEPSTIPPRHPPSPPLPHFVRMRKTRELELGPVEM
jgi:hypothetical protein